MHLLTKSRKDKKPECELEFEKEYEVVREKLTHRICYGGNGGIEF